MARAGTLESLLGPLPQVVKSVLTDYTRAWVKQLRFGAPNSDMAVAAENFAANLVPVRTSSTPDQEVAVEHRLERIPRWMQAGVDPSVVNAHVPAFTITRPADNKYVYLKSATTDASFHLYVE